MLAGLTPAYGDRFHISAAVSLPTVGAYPRPISENGITLECFTRIDNALWSSLYVTAHLRAGTDYAWVFSIFLGENIISGDVSCVGINLSAGPTEPSVASPTHTADITTGLTHVAITATSTECALYVGGTRIGVWANTNPSLWSNLTWGWIELRTVSDEAPVTLNLDSVRMSNVLRYTGASYTVPAASFVVD
jgi:hypothetical protein